VVAVTLLTYSASTPVRIMSRFLVNFCEAGEPDDVSLQNEIAFCNRRTQLQLYPNLFFRLDETLAQCANDAEISFVCAHINISLVGRFSDCVVVKTPAGTKRADLKLTGTRVQ
jgi:hypothetical protein